MGAIDKSPASDKLKAELDTRAKGGGQGLMLVGRSVPRKTEGAAPPGAFYAENGYFERPSVIKAGPENLRPDGSIGVRGAAFYGKAPARPQGHTSRSRIPMVALRSDLQQCLVAARRSSDGARRWRSRARRLCQGFACCGVAVR
jgi:hypothetical protein